MTSNKKEEAWQRYWKNVIIYIRIIYTYEILYYPETIIIYKWIVNNLITVSINNVKKYYLLTQLKKEAGKQLIIIYCMHVNIYLYQVFTNRKNVICRLNKWYVLKYILIGCGIIYSEYKHSRL